MSLSGCAESKPTPKQKLVQQAVVETPGFDFMDTATPIRSWKYLVFHHTATPSGSVETIHKAHLQRRDSAGNPWKGIGYHFLIGNGQGMKDGEIQSTFRWNEQMSGAHAGHQQFNELGIGICLVGNFEENGPTSAQLKAVTHLTGILKQEFGIQDEQILKHGDLKATACPGRLFPFQQIASTPPARLQLVNGQSNRKFSSDDAVLTEGVKNAAAIQRLQSRSGKSRKQKSSER